MTRPRPASGPAPRPRGPASRIRRAVLLVLCAAALGGVTGCHTLNAKRLEYYEPTKETLHTREDGNVVGALKSETVREGARDEGDKTFALGLFQNVND